MGDGLFTAYGLAYATAAGPSNAGSREDGKVCIARPGECRLNSRYYTIGLRDGKSWSELCADETCPGSCRYLSNVAVHCEPEEERRARADDMLKEMVG
jgi:hypothetical protein